MDALLALPFQCAEGASQVQRYRAGQQFKPHWDYFDRDADAPFWRKGQRTWTFMVYLSGCEGGCTRFAELGEALAPLVGRAVIWCNLDAGGRPDPMTLHTGSPVAGGEKFIITRWYLDTYR